MLIFVNLEDFIYVIEQFFDFLLYLCIEFFMVLDFKVNRRLIVGMTINFFFTL